MPTTQAPTIDDYVNDLLLLQLTQREGLPQSANGKPIPPSDPRAAQILKDMGQEKSAEFRRLLTVWLTNLRDGAPLSVVLLPLQRMQAVLEVEAGEYRPRSIAAMSRRETREQCLVDLAQLRIGPHNENDIEALEQLEHEMASYGGIFDEMRNEVQRRIASLRRDTTPPPAPTTPDRKLTRGPLIRLK